TLPTHVCQRHPHSPPDDQRRLVDDNSPLQASPGSFASPGTSDAEIGIGSDDRPVWPILYQVRFALSGRGRSVGGGLLGDDELSDSERRRLAEIESSLRSDDPDFVQRFEQRRLRRRNRRNVAALLAISISVIVIVIGLVRGSVAAAVVGLIAVGATVGLWA